MKHYLTFCACLIGSVLLVPHSDAAEPLTLKAAIDRVLTRHPTVEIQRYDSEVAQGRLRTATQWPNPTLDYAREDLRDNGTESGEWVVGLGFPLDRVWQRGARQEAARARIEESAGQTERLRAELRLAVQRHYAAAYFARQRHRTWDDTRALFAEVARVGRTRLDVGDISGYDERRMRLEAHQFQLREAEARSELEQTHRRLAFLLGDGAYELATAFPSPMPPLNSAGLEKQALEHRAELQIAEAAHRGLQADEQVLRRQRWPASRLFVGYKEQTDAFRGVAAQLSVELPFFDRQQGELQRLEAATIQQSLRREWIQEQIVQEVRNAYERCRLYKDQFALMGSEEDARAALEMARYAYEEGEMSLLEWIDAIRASSEAVALRYDLLEKYQLSLFELERTTGTVLVELE